MSADHGKRLRADCTAEPCWCEVLRFNAAHEAAKLKRKIVPRTTADPRTGSPSTTGGTT